MRGRELKKECGSYVKHGEYEFEASDKELSVSTLAEYEDRDATIEFKFDEDLNLESMDGFSKIHDSRDFRKSRIEYGIRYGNSICCLDFPGTF